MRKVIKEIVAHGFPCERGRLIYALVGGSQLHGVKPEGTDDRKAHARRYKGYAEAQLSRMMGDCGRGKHGQRPELEERFGYDVKAAMHVLRLLHEGIEFVSTGWVNPATA